MGAYGESVGRPQNTLSGPSGTAMKCAACMTTEAREQGYALSTDIQLRLAHLKFFNPHALALKKMDSFGTPSID